MFAPLRKLYLPFGASVLLILSAGSAGTAQLGMVSEKKRENPPVAGKAERTRDALLRYLRSLPARADKKLLSGQQCEAWPKIMETGISDLRKVYDATGKWPAIGGFEYYEMKGSYSKSDSFKPARWREVNPFVKECARMGMIVTISAHMPNPWTGKSAWDCPENSRYEELVDVETPARKAYWKMVVDMADGLEDLSASGVVVLWRPFHELEGTWFWWGGEGKNGKRAEILKRLWREMHSYMVEKRGLKNLIWVFNGYSCHYPGDDTVDINSADIYDDNVGVRLEKIYPRLASRGVKPFALAEFGPNWKRGRKEKYDFSSFVDSILPYVPNCVYFLSWTGPWSLWYNDNAALLMSDPRVVTLRDIAF